MKNIAKNARWVFMIALGCAVFALGFDLFLEPNGLSAGGISGIALIVVHLAPITTVGVATAMMNFPLFFFGGKKIGMRFFVGSIIGTIFFSLFIDLFAGIPVPDTEPLVAALYGGAICGAGIAIVFVNNASTGGTDIISRYINKIRPDTNFFAVTFILNGIVAVSSILVYSEGMLNYKPMALCILYCFLSSFVGNLMLKSTKTAYKFTVITSHKEELIADVTKCLRHGCTEIEAIGSYTGSKRSVLICVINKHQLNDFQKLLSKYNDTFSYYEVVNETYGNFKRVK